MLAASDVAVVCVTHNAVPMIAGFLDSLPPSLVQSPGGVLVVDSGSTDGTTEYVAERASTVEIQTLDGNRGFAAGINAAVDRLRAAGRSPAVVVANPDVRLHPGCLTRLVQELADERTGVVVPRLLDEHGDLLMSLRNPPGLSAVWCDAVLGGPLAHRLGLPTEVIRNPATYDGPASIGWATGALMAISWSCLQQIGAWDERYFLYEEEVDYCRRVRDRGLDVRYVPDARATRVIGDAPVAPWAQALMRVNRVRHLSARGGPWHGLLARTGLLIGDLLRAAAGRPEARAASWALARDASVAQVLGRYRPTADALLAAPEAPSLPRTA